MKQGFKHIVCLLLAAAVLFMACKKEHSCEGCATNNKNKPPISVAGPDQLITLPTDSFSLNGRTSSDPDGSISSYLRTKISGLASFTAIYFLALKEYTIGIFPSIPFICHFPVSVSTEFLKLEYGENECSLKNSIFKPALINAFSTSLML